MAGKVIPALLVAFSLTLVAPPSSAQVLNLTVGRSSQDSQLSRLLPDYSFMYERKDRSVVMQKRDGSARAFMHLLKPVPYLKSTHDYAKHMMSEFKGSDLRPELNRRGYSFLFKEDKVVPCSAVISYFDGISYLMYGACGRISEQEMTTAFRIAKRTLVLDELLYRTSLPTAY